MAIRIVRLGSPRARDEGVRIGAVRYPPRGVRKADLAAGDWYDVWLPLLAPSAEAVRAAKGATSEREWAAFERAFRREMKAPEPSRVLELLAALSHGADFALGCYCAEEARCHRSILRALLDERGAALVEPEADARGGGERCPS